MLNKIACLVWGFEYETWTEWKVIKYPATIIMLASYKTVREFSLSEGTIYLSGLGRNKWKQIQICCSFNYFSCRLSGEHTGYLSVIHSLGRLDYLEKSSTDGSLWVSNKNVKFIPMTCENENIAVQVEVTRAQLTQSVPQFIIYTPMSKRFPNNSRALNNAIVLSYWFSGASAGGARYLFRNEWSVNKSTSWQIGRCSLVGWWRDLSSVQSVQ